MLFLDGSAILVLYRCAFVLPDGSCDAAQLQLHFLTRRQHMTRVQLQAFSVTLKEFCLELDDVQLSPGTRMQIFSCQ